jgi:hypothetical protein
VVRIGRDTPNNAVLNRPAVSRLHAQLERVGHRYRLRDLQSSDGMFVNDQPIRGEVRLNPDDTIRIKPHRFVIGEETIVRYDETGGLRAEPIDQNKWGREELNILKDISVVSKPSQFIVVLGQSGGGKSTLLDAVAGYRPATDGCVLVNDVDVHRDFDAIRNSLGYVPQKDFLHSELTVYEAFDGAAKLRMPPDATRDERHVRVTEVLQDLDLVHRKGVKVSGLRGDGSVERVRADGLRIPEHVVLAPRRATSSPPMPPRVASCMRLRASRCGNLGHPSSTPLGLAHLPCPFSRPRHSRRRRAILAPSCPAPIHRPVDCSNTQAHPHANRVGLHQKSEQRQRVASRGCP